MIACIQRFYLQVPAAMHDTSTGLRGEESYTIAIGWWQLETKKSDGLSLSSVIKRERARTV